MMDGQLPPRQESQEEIKTINVVNKKRRRNKTVFKPMRCSVVLSNLFLSLAVLATARARVDPNRRSRKERLLLAKKTCRRKTETQPRVRLNRGRNNWHEAATVVTVRLLSAQNSHWGFHPTIPKAYSPRAKHESIGPSCRHEQMQRCRSRTLPPVRAYLSFSRFSIFRCGDIIHTHDVLSTKPYRDVEYDGVVAWIARDAVTVQQ